MAAEPLELQPQQIQDGILVIFNFSHEQDLEIQDALAVEPPEVQPPIESKYKDEPRTGS